MRPAVDGGERGGEPGSACHRVQHDIAGPRRDLGDGGRPRENLRQAELAAGVAAALRLGVTRELHVLSGACALHGDHLGAQFERLRGQQARVTAAGGQAGHPEPAGISPHDVDGLCANRPGRAEDDKIAFPAGCGGCTTSFSRLRQAWRNVARQ